MCLFFWSDTFIYNKLLIILGGESPSSASEQNSKDYAIQYASSPDGNNITRTTPGSPQSDSSMDSGIAETPTTSKRVKKLRFTVAAIHEFKESTLEKEFHQSRSDYEGHSTFRAKFAEVSRYFIFIFIHFLLLLSNSSKVK